MIQGQKQSRKQKQEKYEKKLQTRKLSICEALQEQFTIDWLKQGNPAFLSMLNSSAMSQIISYLIIVGPPQDKIRSYKIPMITSQLLSTLSPKVYELFFLEDPNAKGGHVLGKLLDYFNGEPNYVISGYVCKIITNLMVGNPARVLEYILTNQPERMLRFMESISVAELILRLIIVDDILLNSQIKERIALFESVINLYESGKANEESLSNINHILCEAIIRLWSQKHKQLGRFSSCLFRLVEIVLDSNNLHQQQNLIIICAKHLSQYTVQAPYLIVALYKKIYTQLNLTRTSNEFVVNQSKNKIPKLSMKKYKCLVALTYIFNEKASLQIIGKYLANNNIFHILFEMSMKYEWSNIALIEIDKIFKSTLNSQCQNAYVALARAHFFDKLKELVRNQGGKSRGFSGLLKNIIENLKQSHKKNQGYAKYLKKSKSEAQITSFLTPHLDKPNIINEQQSIKVVNQIAKPFYSISKLPEFFSSFLDETEAINARLLKQSPSKHSSKAEQQDVLHEIQNQHKYVYKILNQLVSEGGESKKVEEIIE